MGVFQFPRTHNIPQEQEKKGGKVVSRYYKTGELLVFVFALIGAVLIQALFPSLFPYSPVSELVFTGIVIALGTLGFWIRKLLQKQ